MRCALLAIAAACVLAGCGSSRTAAPTAASSPPASFPDDANCEVYSTTTAIAIYVYTPNHDPRPFCRGLVRRLSGPSDYWRAGYADTSGMKRYCDMLQPPPGYAELQVYGEAGSGATFPAQGYCGNLAHAAWIDRGP